MAETLVVQQSDKNGKYEELLPQIKSLVEGETNRVANLSNVAAALKMTFDFFLGWFLPC